MSDTTDSGRISLRTSNLKTSSLSLKTSSLNIHTEGGGETITIDPVLDDSSTNAVQNRVIKAALDGKASVSHTHTASQITDLSSVLENKQEKLVSGTNIKTINGNSLLGEGDITIEGGGVSIEVDSALDATSTNPVENKTVTEALNAKQKTLISGTDIKTINGESILGSGDLTVTSEGVVPSYTVKLKGVDTSLAVRNTYSSYIPISGVITASSNRPTVTSTEGYETLEALIEGLGINQDMNPDFILDMVSTSSPYFYIAYYKVVMFKLTVYYFKVEANSLFSSFTDYIPSSGSKVYCMGFEGNRDFYVWNGSVITKNPTSTQTIKYLDGSTIMLGADTIYEIVEDIDLNGSTITPAVGSIIKYGGGKIKNGTINGSNGVWIDCPDIVFFENMRFREITGDQVFKDTWFADIFEEGSLKGLSHVSLSKDYQLSSEAMMINSAASLKSSAPHDMLVLKGNGHTLQLPSQTLKKYKSSVIQFIRTSYIEVYDLDIRFDSDTYCRIQTVFDTNIGIFHNVRFNGLCRFAAAYSNTVPTDIYGYFSMYPQLQFYGCNIRVPTFAVEGPFNIVIARDSVFARNSDESTNNTIFSIAPFGYSDEFVNNSYVDFENCYMEGGWETPNHGKRLLNGNTYTYYYTVSGKDTDTYTNNITYNKVRFKSCELVFPYIGFFKGFSTTRWTDTHSGTTSLAEYEDCSIFTGLAPGRFYTDNLTFRRCKITLMHNNNSYHYPFVLHCPTGKLTFDSCVFDGDSYTSKSGRSWPASYNGGLVRDSDTSLTHYVLAITEYPSDDFKVVLKNNTFIEGQYRNKVDIYCAAPANGTLADRVECYGNKYAVGKPRMLESGYRDTAHAPWSSAYGKIAEDYWSSPSSRVILPIEHSAFRGGEAITSSPYSFDACTHDFDYSVGNIYSTSTQTAYYIYDAMRAVSRKIQFE